MNYKLASIIEKKVHPVLFPRIWSQHREDETRVVEGTNPSDLINYIFCWSDTKEGHEFWSEMKEIYFHSNEAPSEDQIFAVFKRFGMDHDDPDSVPTMRPTAVQPSYLF